MAISRVDVLGEVTMTPDACWSILRAFCHPWHPAIETMQSEAGGKVRAFMVKGERRLYKERLTWLSDSDRSLRYTALQGIAGAERYEATVSVTAGRDGSSQVRWQAKIEANQKCVDDIAQGTEAIFRMGIEALALSELPSGTMDSAIKQAATSKIRILNTSPTLSVLTSETENAPLCLFLHGIGGQKENWAPQIAAIGQELSAAAMDLRGYGNSEIGPDQSTIDDYCQDILAVCDAFGAKELVLCGLSYGAWIATSFAMRYPEMLKGLVLAGGCTGMSEADPAERQAFRDSREVPLSEGQTPAEFAPAVVDVLAGPRATAHMRRALTASMSAIPVETYCDALHCFTHPEDRFDFGRLTMPVLLMTGAHDRLAPPNDIRNVAERMWSQNPTPNIRFEVIADAGHVCNLEQPDAFNCVLGEFLRAVRT